MRSSRRRTEVLQEGYAQHGGKQQHFSKPLERGIDEALMASLRASLTQLEKGLREEALLTWRLYLRFAV